jgi:alanyl-tRNA synthetase
MTTEKLYFNDPYLKEFSAVITDIYEKNGKMAVILDRTAFFPEGGGQNPDTGTLTLSDGVSVNVIDTQEKGESVEHLTDIPYDKSPFKTGEHITGRINWERRFDQMQQHSGEHIVSGMICSAFNCDNVGFHIGEEFVTIDYNVKISFDDILKIEERANRYIWENHKFISMWPSKDEIKNIKYRSKKELTGNIRIASFPGADTCACCGTHVSYSAEVGLVKFTSSESFHGGTRFFVRFGKRAFDFLSVNYSQNKSIAVSLSTKETNTFDAVKKISDEMSNVKYELNRLLEEKLDIIASAYKDKGDTLYITSSMSPDMVRKLADKLRNSCRGRAAVFAGSDTEGYKYAICGEPDDVVSLNNKIKSELKGRGGGKGGFAQGQVSACETSIRSLFTTD